MSPRWQPTASWLSLEQGLTVEGVDAVPAWLNQPENGSGTTQPNTPSIMNVSVKPGGNGRYQAVITIADDPTLAHASRRSR